MWKKYFKIGMILLIDLSNKMNCYYHIKHRYFLECKMGSPIFDSFFITNNFSPIYNSQNNLVKDNSTLNMSLTGYVFRNFNT